MIPEKTQVRVDRVIGQRLEGYEVLEQIGEGKSGTVYKAYNQVQETHAVIKVFKPELVPDDETGVRLFEEARASTAIGAKGIVKVFGFGKLSDGRHWWAREFFDGDSLDWVLRNRPLTKDVALEVLDQVAAAVGTAHAWQMVHRHLKPSNVFLVNQPDMKVLVKVLDFGLAKPGATPLTDVDDLLELARELGINGLLESDPAKRPQNVEAVRTAIAALKRQHEIDQANITEPPAPADPRPRTMKPVPPRRRWVVPVLIGTGLAAAVTAGLFALAPPPEEQELPVLTDHPPAPPVPDAPADPPAPVQPPPRPPPADNDPPRPPPVRPVRGPAPSAEALSDRISKLDARLKARKKGWTDDPEAALFILNKQRLRLTGQSPDENERRDISRMLDGFEKSYLGR